MGGRRCGWRCTTTRRAPSVCAFRGPVFAVRVSVPTNDKNYLYEYVFSVRHKKQETLLVLYLKACRVCEYDSGMFSCARARVSGSTNDTSAAKMGDTCFL